MQLLKSLSFEHFTLLSPHFTSFSLTICPTFAKIPLCVVLPTETSSSTTHKYYLTMETPVALNIQPLNAPQKELEWKALGDRDYQMIDSSAMSSKFNIHLQNELKAQYLSGADILGIWDSILPIYNLPQVNVLPDLINQCRS